MTLLSIVQTFCYRSGINAPSTLVATTDTAELQLLHLLYEVHEDLRAAGPWPQQKKLYSFDLEANRAKYPLPKDFYAPCTRTQYDNDSVWRLRGPLLDSEFVEEFNLSLNVAQIGYRVFGPDFNPTTSGGQFQVSPTPTSAGATLSYEYWTKNLFLPPHWTASEAGITTNIYRNANGNIYKATAVTTGTTGTTPPSHTTGSAVDSGVTWTFQDAVYDTLIKDADLSLWDDDLVLLGLKSKWPSEKGFVRERAEEEFRKRLNISKGRLNGNLSGSFVSRYGYGPRFSYLSRGWDFS